MNLSNILKKNLLVLLSVVIFSSTALAATMTVTSVPSVVQEGDSFIAVASTSSHVCYAEWKLDGTTVASYQYSWPMCPDGWVMPRIFYANPPYGQTHTMQVGADTGWPGPGWYWSAVQSFYVNKIPTANAGCDRTVSVGDTVTFNGDYIDTADDSIKEYRWDFEGNGIWEGHTTSTATHVYSSAGIYNARLVVEDQHVATSLQDVAKITVIPNEVPQIVVATITPGSGHVNDVFTFTSVANDPDGTVVLTDWNFGDGSHASSSSAAFTIDHAYSSSGTYTVLLTIEDDKGATTTQTFTITVSANSYPTLSLSDIPAEIREGDVITITATASDSSSYIAYYAWELDDVVVDTLGGNLGTDITRSIMFASLTERQQPYKVDFIVKDNNGLTTVESSWILVKPANEHPIVDAGINQAVKIGETVMFDADVTDDDQNNFDFEWQFGDGTTDTSSLSITHVYNAPGVYTVRLYVTDSDGVTVFDKVYITVSPNMLPVAEAGPDQSIDQGTQIALDASGSADADGTITKYEWDFEGDGIFDAEGETVLNTYYTSAVARLRVTDNNGATDLDYMIIWVTLTANEDPVADFTYFNITPTNFLFDGSDSYDPDGTIVAWDWNFGDGTTGDGEIAAHDYIVSGDYLVSLTVTDDFGATDIKYTLIHVKSGTTPTNYDPVAVITITPSVGDTSTPFEFDATFSDDPDGIIIGYLWEFGDGSTSTDAVVIHMYPTPATYIVKLTVTDNDGATDTAYQVLVVLPAGTPANQPPIADFQISPTAGDYLTTFYFTDMSTDIDGTVDAWNWVFGDGQTSTDQNPSHQYASPATYTVTLFVTDDDGATDYHQESLIVTEQGVPLPNAIPVASAGPDKTVYEDNEFTIYGSGTDSDGYIALYEWDFNQDNTVYTLSVGQSRTVDGYTAKLIAITNSTPYIFNATFEISWPDGTPAISDPMTNNTYDKFDSKKMILYVDEVSNETASIRIHAYDYQSTFSGEVNHIYESTGTYLAVLRVTDDGGAQDTDFAIMTVVSKPVSLPPTANAGTDQTVVIGQEVTFIGIGTDPDGTVILYEWDFNGDGVYDWSSATAGISTYTFTQSGTYVARLRVTDNLLLTTVDTVTIYVTSTSTGNMKPIAYAGNDKTAETGEWLSFVGTGTDPDTDGYIILYEWDFDYNASEGFDADWTSTAIGVTTHKYTRAGIFIAVLRVTDNGGLTDTDALTVTVSGPDVPDDQDTSGSISYDFHLYALDVFRTYEYDESDATTTITVKFTNLLGEQRNFLIRDVIPKDFARYVDEVDITPAPDKIYNNDPEIGWNITLGDHESFEVTYVFEKYINKSDFEDLDAPGVTEYETPVADDGDEGDEGDVAGADFTGMVFGAFANPWFGLLAFVIIVGLVIAFWKRDYVVAKWKSWVNE